MKKDMCTVYEFIIKVSMSIIVFGTKIK
jgi:hypothetical protein